MALTETYIQNMIRLQTRLHAYLLTLLADSAAADDVLQETNVVLCRKSDEFVEGTDFDAWAFRIARIQCMAYWRIRRRERLVFDNASLECFAAHTEQRMVDVDAQTCALRACLAELPDHQRAMIETRYGGQKRSVKGLAEQLGRSEAVISQTLYRIRNRLLHCIQSRITIKQMN